ncbi:MAG: nicotinate-nucleotide adenylyltransferase [Chloroflexota bacterium]|nr:nicotinate-nucleotide adenylyltransferase [Chloroflexota bacterium]
MIAARRIGILGGTFDPVHIAHLHIATCARHELGLDEVRFVPAGSPPHKPGRPVTQGSHRLRMLEIATLGIDAFVADPIDLADDAPSYTADLLARIREAHPDDNLWFIMGGDSLVDFPQWHQPRRILSLARLAVAERPGWDTAAAMASGCLSELAPRVDPFPSVPIDLSATLIRARIAAAQPVDWLVPTEVLAYIRDHDLYVPRHGTD